MINKQVSSPAEALADVFDGAVVMVSGFGEAGSPIELIHALIDQGAKDLTVVSNNCGSGEVGLAALLKAGRVRKVVCSFPRTANSTVFPDLYHSGKIELELVPQGTLAERIRAGGQASPRECDLQQDRPELRPHHGHGLQSRHRAGRGGRRARADRPRSCGIAGHLRRSRRRGRPPRA